MVTPVIHDLKCWPVFFKDIATGRKAFEIRNNDRDYRVDDYLLLREWDPSKERYSEHVALVKVTAVLTHDDFVIDSIQLIPEGVAVMGIQILDSPYVDRETLG